MQIHTFDVRRDERTFTVTLRMRFRFIRLIIAQSLHRWTNRARRCGCALCALIAVNGADSVMENEKIFERAQHSAAERVEGVQIQRKARRPIGRCVLQWRQQPLNVRVPITHIRRVKGKERISAEAKNVIQKRRAGAQLKSLRGLEESADFDPHRVCEVVCHDKEELYSLRENILAPERSLSPAALFEFLFQKKN